VRFNSQNNSRKTSTPVFKLTLRLDQLREQIHYLHYSLRTEAVLGSVVKTLMWFHHRRHPHDVKWEWQVLSLSI
jgi:hypothetical protein